MTATDASPLVCPNCGHTNTAVAGSGSGMCFDCAHMWDPATVVGVPAPTVDAPAPLIGDVVPIGTPGSVGPLEPFGMASVEDVFDAPAPPKDPPNPTDYPPTWAGLADFRHDGGSMRNETWWEEIMGGPLDGLHPADEAVTEPPAEVAAVLVIAGQIIAAGIEAAWTMENPSATLVARTGYLPDDPDLLPIIEQACAVALGMVIDRSHDDIADFAEAFGVEIETTDTGDPTEDGADG